MGAKYDSREGNPERSHLRHTPRRDVRVGVQIREVDLAHRATATKPKAVDARTAKVRILWGSLETLCDYVQQLCDASPQSALVIAKASGFHVATVGLTGRFTRLAHDLVPPVAWRYLRRLVRGDESTKTEHALPEPGGQSDIGPRQRIEL